MLGKSLNLGLLIGPNHHQIHHAADYFGAVFYGLGSSQLTAIGGQVNDRSTHLVHAGFKTDPCAGGSFFKNHCQRAVSQGLVLVIGFELLFD